MPVALGRCFVSDKWAGQPEESASPPSSKKIERKEKKRKEKRKEKKKKGGKKKNMNAQILVARKSHDAIELNADKPLRYVES